MAAEHRRSHIASVTYLNSWTVEGRLQVVRPSRHTAAVPGRPESVAFRNGFWSKDDHAVQKAAEEACGLLESEFPNLLKRVLTAWPLKNEAREALAEFMALHVIRTPAWQRVHADAREAATADIERKWTGERPFKETAAPLLGDRHRIEMFRRHLHLTAALVVNMHWTLVAWSEPALATGDHPASVFPLSQPGVLTPYEAVPGAGIGRMLEFRFPLTPDRLLVGSWLDGPDLDLGNRGDEATAINVNESVIGQAEHEWFFRPGAYPRLTPVIERARRPSTPLSFEFFNCDALAVLKSRRRRHALKEVKRIMDSDGSSTISVVDFGKPRLIARRPAA